MNLKQLNVSVLVSCEHERNDLNILIEDLLRQDYPLELIEIILIGIEGNQKKDERYQYYSTEHQSVEYVRCTENNVPKSLNLGIQQSQGDIIILLENNVRCYKDFVSSIVLKFADEAADCLFGNSILTVSSPGIIQLAMKECLTNNFGHCDSYVRSGKWSNKAMSYPFGCYRRDCIDTLNGFSEDLHEGYYEDFFERLTQSNSAVSLQPEIKVMRYVPVSLSNLAAEILHNSYYKPLLVRKNSKATKFKQMFAPLFVFFLIICWIAGFFDQKYLIVFFGVILVYTSYAFLKSLSSYRQNRRIGLLAAMPYVYFIIHGSSGWGYIMGVIRFWLWFKTTPLKHTSAS